MDLKRGDVCRVVAANTFTMDSIVEVLDSASHNYIVFCRVIMGDVIPARKWISINNNAAWAQENDLVRLERPT